MSTAYCGFALKNALSKLLYCILSIDLLHLLFLRALESSELQTFLIVQR